MRSQIKSLTELGIAVLFMGIGMVTSFGFTTTDTIAIRDTGKPSLKVISGDSKYFSYQVPNALPGTNGRISKRAVNIGNRAGILSVCFSPVVNTSGTIGEYADGNGDLGANTEIAVYVDVDQSGDWNTVDVGLRSDGTNYSYPAALDYDPLDTYSGIRWNAVKSISASSEYDFIMMWRIPITVGNEIQGDSVSFDISFVLDEDIN
jgi:hypothetical protein